MNHHFVRILIAMTICIAPSITNLHARAVTNLCDAIEDLLDEANEVCTMECDDLTKLIYETTDQYERKCRRSGGAPGHGGWRYWLKTPECLRLEDGYYAMRNQLSWCLYKRTPDTSYSQIFIQGWIMPDILATCKRDQAGLNQCSEICSEAENYKCAE